MVKIEEMQKGEAYIRIPTRSKPYNTMSDWSFTNRIMIFDGMSEAGKPIMHYLSENFLTKYFGNKPQEIPLTQGWMPADIIWNGPKTDMSAWVGKRIIQVQPILINPSARKCIHRHGSMKLRGTPYKEKQFATNYMGSSLKLISATKYHLVVEDDDGYQVILDQRYTNIESWALYEKMK